MAKGITPSIIILLVLIFVGVIGTSTYVIMKRTTPITTTTTTIPITTTTTTQPNFKVNIEPRENPKTFAPSIPIKVELSLSDFVDKPYGENETRPPPNTSTVKIANLTATITVDPAYGDAPNTTLKVTLPEGIGLFDGNLTWNGDVKANSPTNIINTIRVNYWGNWVIKATAGFLIGGGWYGDTDNIYVSVCPKEIVASYAPPKNNWISQLSIPISQNDENIYADLFVDSTPENNTVRLTFRVISAKSLGPSKIQIYLPQVGLKLIDGTLTWEGLLEELGKGEPAEKIINASSYEIKQIFEGITPMPPNVTNETKIFFASINATVQPTSSGEGTIFGYVEAQPNGTLIRKVVVVHISALSCGDYYHITSYKPCKTHSECVCLSPTDLVDACGRLVDSWQCVEEKCLLIPAGAAFYCDKNIGCAKCQPNNPCVREDIQYWAALNLACCKPLGIYQCDNEWLKNITCECVPIGSLGYSLCLKK